MNHDEKTIDRGFWLIVYRPDWKQHVLTIRETGTYVLAGTANACSDFVEAWVNELRDQGYRTV